MSVEDYVFIIEDLSSSGFDGLFGSLLLLLDKLQLLKKVLVCQGFLDERSDQSRFDLVKRADVRVAHVLDESHVDNIDLLIQF